MTLESMLEAYEETYGHKITGPGKVKIPAAYARNRFIEAAYAQGHTMKDISKLLKIDYTNVYRLLRKPIKTIQKSGERVAAIVQDLLTLSRRELNITEVLNINHIIQLVNATGGPWTSRGWVYLPSGHRMAS